MANKTINDFALKSDPDLTDEILIQETGGGTTKKILLGDAHKAKVGWITEDDLATKTTAVAHTGSGGFIQIPNDGAGPQTDKTYAPTGVDDLWNTTTDQFDWSDLTMGDMVDIRIDLKVTTTAANQEFTFRYEFGSGSGTPFYLDLGTIIEKAAGQYGYLDYTGIYMGNSLVLGNPAELQFDTDSAATVEVGAFYIKVTRR